MASLIRTLKGARSSLIIIIIIIYLCWTDVWFKHPFHRDVTTSNEEGASGLLKGTTSHAVTSLLLASAAMSSIGTSGAPLMVAAAVVPYYWMWKAEAAPVPHADPQSSILSSLFGYRYKSCKCHPRKKKKHYSSSSSSSGRHYRPSSSSSSYFGR